MQYLSINQITYQLVECEDVEETVEKVRNEEADAMLGIDVGLEVDMYAIGKFIDMLCVAYLFMVK